MDRALYNFLESFIFFALFTALVMIQMPRMITTDPYMGSRPLDHRVFPIHLRASEYIDTPPVPVFSFDPFDHYVSWLENYVYLLCALLGAIHFYIAIRVLDEMKKL